MASDAWDLNHLTDFDTSAERGGEIVSYWCRAVGLAYEPAVAGIVVADILAWVALRNNERIGGMVGVSPKAVASAAMGRFHALSEEKWK